MSWMDFLVQLTKAVASPVAALVGVYWFKAEIKRVFDAVAYFIKERKFKTRFPGGSIEVAGTDSTQVQRTLEQIEAAPSPPDSAKDIEQTVEARQFILRDDSGKARAELGFIQQSGKSVPMFRIFDTQGNTKILIGLNSDDDAVFISESSNGSMASLMAAESSGPLLVLTSPDKKTATMLDLDHLNLAGGKALLGAVPGGPGLLGLLDENDKLSFSAP